MDVAQRIQPPTIVAQGKAAAVVALLPKVPGAIQHLVKAHGGVPIQPVHNFGQCRWLLGGQQVVHVIAHNAQGIQPKSMFFLALLDSVE